MSQRKNYYVTGSCLRCRKAEAVVRPLIRCTTCSGTWHYHCLSISTSRFIDLVNGKGGSIWEWRCAQCIVADDSDSDIEILEVAANAHSIALAPAAGAALRFAPPQTSQSNATRKLSSTAIAAVDIAEVKSPQTPPQLKPPMPLKAVSQVSAEMPWGHSIPSSSVEAPRDGNERPALAINDYDSDDELYMSRENSVSTDGPKLVPLSGAEQTKGRSGLDEIMAKTHELFLLDWAARMHVEERRNSTEMLNTGPKVKALRFDRSWYV